MEFIIPWIPAWDTKAYKDPNTGIFKLDIDKVKSGSGNTGVVRSYAIRQLK